MWGLTVRKNDYYHFINWLFIYHSLYEHGEYLLTEVYHRIVSGFNLSYISCSEQKLLCYCSLVMLSQVFYVSRNTILFILDEDEKRKIRNTRINFKNEYMRNAEIPCTCTCKE